jgi:DNA-binding transcriptional LysR family regulator
MDLNRVATFVRVVDEGSFTAAARVLRLPKSSVSRAVSLLESELGAQLLARSSRKLRLTEAGSAFYERASRGISGVQEAAAAVADLQGLLRGPIRITAPVDAGVWMLAPLVAEFVAEHPAVKVDVVLTGRVVDLVADGFDFALRAAPLADSSMIARKLTPVPLGLYAAPSYLARKGTPRSLAELAQHDCILFRADRARATWKLRGPLGDESVTVSGPVSADDFSFVQRVVQAGAGIGFMPSFLFEKKRTQGIVRVLPAYVSEGEAPFSLVYPSARYLPQRAAVFRDFLLGKLSGDAAPGLTK